jgi:hypothetical protein
MKDWSITLIPLVATIIASFAASSGFWAWMNKRDAQKGATMKLLLGIAHDRIIFLGMSYVDRGWITKDEYEDFLKYLYEPYSEFGGNGLAEKVFLEVQKLPIKGSHNPVVQIIREKNEHHRAAGE